MQVFRTSLSIGQIFRDGLKAKGLSNREVEVSFLVTKGLSNREVASQLFVTEKTVKFHLTNIYKKIGIRAKDEGQLFKPTRTQLIVYCLPLISADIRTNFEGGAV